MFELVRYTFLVLLGLSCIVVLFVSIPLAGLIVAQSGDPDTNYNLTTTYWIWGIMAMSVCLWLSSSFVLKVPRTIFGWLAINKDNIAAYSVISLIFVMFVIA